jgi:fucose permease
MNDASYGPLLPYLETYYDLSYLIVSLVFLSPFVGYTLSALINNTIHMKLGQRGVAVIAPTAHLIAYIVICLHPPYPVLVVAFVLAGFGNGLVDSAWNAWIGAMQNANEILGLLHGAYGAGATIAPLIATSMISKAGLPWYSWYYVMVGVLFTRHKQLTDHSRRSVLQLSNSRPPFMRSGQPMAPHIALQLLEKRTIRMDFPR